jgi:hypothetical protein
MKVRSNRVAARAGAAVMVAAITLGLLGGVAGAKPASATVICPTSAVTNVSYLINGTTTFVPNSQQLDGFTAVSGDTVKVTFTIGVPCTLSLVSYNAQSQIFDPSQTVFSADTQTFTAPGTYSLTITLPPNGSGSSQGCSPNQHDNSNGNGANQSPGPYDPQNCGGPSGNGVSDNNNSSKPCAGCVGNADAKNPPGQYPNGSDNNAGYECDRNQGVGQTNPAHSGCSGAPHWQMDFVVGEVITDFASQGTYQQAGRLINYVNR